METPRNIPQLCFGEVRHTRVRPVRNRFAYPVFFLRLPLRSMSNSGFDSRLLSRNRMNILAFYDRDHGDGQRPLLAWIDALLSEEGITDADGEIWLQTFPRVLGYVFNPVSFWFCHRRNGDLRAILCEVNNTFGERHCYLLDTGGAMPYGIELTAKKAFHVSPFCAVKGHYRFRFMHSALTIGHRTEERTVACIDYHDDNHDGYRDGTAALLLTSLAGASRPVSDATAAHAFFFYPLMTIGVMARIHWQALRLWFKRVPFFRKPTPPTSELSR